MRTIVVSGGDLFHLALKYLGDATQWSRIAQANGILDPQIAGVVTLKIPKVDLSQTGGVLVL
jgi:nucleoid-associated protein YgaU